MSSIAFFDTEVCSSSNQILDIGCILSNGSGFHNNQLQDFIKFVDGIDFLCGHNILQHDLKFIQKASGNLNWGLDKCIDTLLISPLLFPQKPYHNLLKDDKIYTEDLNNPYNDSLKARDLFYDEVNAFHKLDAPLKRIYQGLLYHQKGFINFFKYLNINLSIEKSELIELIKNRFFNKLCNESNFQSLIDNHPIALAYSLALLSTSEAISITPPWVLKNHPEVENIIFQLRNSPCENKCNYCKQSLDPVKALKKYFKFDSYRKYGELSLQEDAVRSAILGESLLAIFPTGGGKSITFQVPALMSGENAGALTVVISPLQSLMKDQVDNLEKKGITEAVTINGLLDPIERSKSIERVENGTACILYLSPESLRSITIERLLLKRKIARFVIDEAHCFSSWGQDFRVDYLYIGDFIKKIQLLKGNEFSIPVSCFTATAKPKVIEDILDYFKEKLDLQLQTFRANISRNNLHYKVYQKNNDEDKYNELRNIIIQKNCPTIVYVSRTKRAVDLAERLSSDGFKAKPYHGKMDKEEKTQNQDDFMNDKVNIIVATSAFGMGVDKSNVGVVIHFDISDSLENYIQEAGRAGRDENINAECFILFNESDLDRHFTLLNQTKISSKEINQLWRAIKDLTKTRNKVSNSALELARKAGWDENIRDIETKVLTAIAALEDVGFLKRGQNNPVIYANSIMSKNLSDAIQIIQTSPIFSNIDQEKAIRIIKKLFSSKSKRLSTDEIAESRVDYISDQLGFERSEVIRIVELMRSAKILANAKDLTAFIKKNESVNKIKSIISNFAKQEKYLNNKLSEIEATYHLKEMIEELIQQGSTDTTLNKLKISINFWSIKKWIKRTNHISSKNHVQISLIKNKEEIIKALEKLHTYADLIFEYLFQKALEIAKTEDNKEEILIEFSILELKEIIERKQGMFISNPTLDEIEDALFYLSKIEALKIEGGFIVVHNKLFIERQQLNNRIQYKEGEYEKLKKFYEQKVNQIHIVGEYAKKMYQNYDEALVFVDDYFTLNFSSFISKYFPGGKRTDIQRSLTPEKFQRIFSALSLEQIKVINDSVNQYLLVAAGPGSGKTRILVHKLASLLLIEQVKHEQLLMLTFSRAAATEFKMRLGELIGKAAHFTEIKTFHSYCFDLLGRVGSLLEAEKILPTAIEKIRNHEIEPFRITKTVLVIDEAQDINSQEFELIKALMDYNEDMSVIMVGDDDQNIYEFRGSDSAYMQKMISERNAVLYEIVKNYRSKSNIVDISNQWISQINGRLKITPNIADQNENGNIKIIEYSTRNILVAACNDIKNSQLSGSTCVLTKTNEDASLLVGLLKNNGIRAKLIQSNDGFNLNNWYEIRYFSNIIEQKSITPLIDNEDWESAKAILYGHIQLSSYKDLVFTIIQKFEKLYSDKKFKSDWITFINESKMEDFLRIDSEIIYVSTIHKAKGKEFENVFLVLRNFIPKSIEEIKQVYVAITRAKSNLFIHYQGDYFSSLSAESFEYIVNNEEYSEPNQIELHLTHKDIWLGYFEHVQSNINHHYSGTKLYFTNEDLVSERGNTLVKFSRDFKKKLNEYYSKGFVITESTVNHIVYWNNTQKGKEVKVILPTLVLKK